MMNMNQEESFGLLLERVLRRSFGYGAAIGVAVGVILTMTFGPIPGLVTAWAVFAYSRWGYKRDYHDA